MLRIAVLPPLLGLLLLTGCDLFGSSSSPPSFEGTLLPLAPGTEWTLLSSSADDPPPDTTRIRALHADRIDNRSYTAVTGLWGGDTTLLREGDHGHVYRREDGTERLWLDPSVDGDSTYTYRNYEVRVSRVRSLDTPTGRFENCIRFSFDIPEAVDDERRITVKPGTGFVERWHVWGGAWRLGDFTTEGDA